MQLAEDGFFHQGPTPTAANHLTRKGYVDGELDKKANTSHQHRVVDFPMTERTNWINNSSHPDKFVYTRPDGYLHGSVPTSAAHVANKEYVDAKVAEATRPGVIHSGSGSPPSTIPGAVSGDWWLNTTTMELYKITGV